jgi:hypothetical protein
MTMNSEYVIEQEDASRYLPHNPLGVEYEHRVYHGHERHIFTGERQRRLVFSGSRADCEAFVRRVSA